MATEFTSATDANGVGHRLAAMVSLLGTRARAADLAGISTDQLARYISGKSQPALPPVARLAEQAGVSLDWVWSGEGPMRLADRRLSDWACSKTTMTDCLRLVETVLRERGVQLTPEKKASVTMLLCELAGNRPQLVNREVVMELIELAQ